jgi:hypothetical protein
MKDLYLPATARRPDNEVAREQQQMLDEMEAVRGSLKYYQQRLDEQYSGVKVMLAKPHTTIEGLKPGYYHLIYDVPGVGTWIEPYEGPDGEWRDLDEGIMVLAAQSDTWNDRVRRDIAEQKRKAAAAEEADRLRARMDRAHEFDERWHSANSTQILVPRSI